MNLIIADTVTSAKAMMRWMGLSGEEWHPVAYGDDVSGVYGSAKLVRPSEGVEEWHVEWFLRRVVTSVLDKISTLPVSWDLSEYREKALV